MPVTSMFQVKIGMRNMVMPGARRQKMVVTRLTPAKMVASPVSTSAMIHRSAPAPGEFDGAGQRRVGHPAERRRAARVRKLISRISPPKSEQVVADSRFSRGNAMSGAPICSGTM